MAKTNTSANAAALARIQAAEARAATAQAKANIAAAKATLERAKVEAQGKVISYDWSGDKPKMKITNR